MLLRPSSSSATLGPFVVVLAAWILPVVTGQTTNATCLPFYAWTNNSRKQSACQVAATLLGVCGLFEVLPLPSDSHYSGPSLATANPCICNTVVYSLMSACATCQGSTYETWSTWSGNCPNVAINSFPKPIPPNVFVPGWAYFDVKASDTFNQTAARLNANSTTESTALPVPSSTSTSTSIASTTSTSTTSASPPARSTQATNSSTNPPSGSNEDRIMGGIVGGTVGFALLLGFVHWWYNRRRRLSAAALGVPLPSPVEGPEQQRHEPAPADMQQYLANTKPMQLANSSYGTSLASPTSAQFSHSSAPGSIRSEVRSYV